MNTAQQVLDHILAFGPASRAELARTLQLSRPTASTVIEHLLRLGLLSEYGTARRSIGRPPTLLTLNVRHRLVAGVEVDVGRFQVTIGDLRGDPIAFRHVAWQRGELGANLRRALDELCEAYGSVPLQTLVIGLPGVVEAGTVHYAPNLPELEHPAFLEQLQAMLPVPALIMNDVNLAAAGEARPGELLAYIAIGSGLGVGLTRGQEILGGHRGRAGEIGYLPAAGRDTPLEELLSERGLARLLGLQPAQLSEQLRSRDLPGLRHKAARPFFDALIQVMQVLTLTLDPTRIVIGGRIGEKLFTHLPTLQRQLQGTLPFTPEIGVTHDAAQAVPLGALRLGASRASQELLQSLASTGTRRPPQQEVSYA